MGRFFQILAIFLLPVVLVGGVYLAGLTIPVPHLGRDYVITLVLPKSGQPVDLPKIYGPPDNSRPLVVIDAGHGGKDPGTVSGDRYEKDVVLELALALKDRLIEEGGIRVALTREDDTFLVLQERPEIARRLNADLFISLHADSAGDSERAYGASVYTLSREASSEAAARFANRENNADLLNGVVVKNQSDPVNDILVELSQRRVQETSREFGQLIEREGKGKHRFHSQTQRSAALAVLRAPDVPAVLFEVGFLTNADDAAQLSSEEGRQEFATFVARAIRIFFARQSTSEG
ncbi:MAG: N-acetylmuramoyl-L-alanine amidase [Citromicrobium sp.]|jgi:N-acetylmuramoyl-L-alanine amidase|nr:N-acetylmuramoyl-L-alanine amidase [Citromicrobium sp.]MAO95470.1 N-acetylmuramoyl-L-alanine amidase [Citromicrobium sp.]MBD76356.1 N-acetylmuramoyl-L-alanine amidase [Citromicrobium sp.]MBT47711.1 N-acetylmuramoyl-L-alanine amidase [Citromicrobium sp.]|tara:strand:+ start:512 stop:1387 length:876 start_codon:yes stop_codon:yes gene_type:complete